MRIFTTFRKTSLRPAIGIGNYDGFHLGHRKILESVVGAAGPDGVPGVITFRTHTRLRSGRDGANLLTTTRQRLEHFRRAGVRACWLVEFDRGLAAISPREFVERILVERLGVRAVCVGEGFRFGSGRGGTADLLRELAPAGGFAVREIPSVRIGGREVRSSLIREEIARGRMAAAARLLGRPYCLTGRVVGGRGKGRGLGYPTANFHPEQLLPPPGVYAARVEAGFGPRDGLLYIGSSPTFSSPGPRPVIAEAHIFDWSGRLGGRRIKVSLIKKLRGDIKFQDEKALIARMQRDELRARTLLSSDSGG